MNNSLKVDTEALEKVVSILEKKISNLKDIYDDIDKKLQNINGDTELWKGKVQESTYNYYLEISKDFPKTIEELNKYKSFLKNVITKHKDQNQSINKDIDNNGINLDLN